MQLYFNRVLTLLFMLYVAVSERLRLIYKMRPLSNLLSNNFSSLSTENY